MSELDTMIFCNRQYHFMMVMSKLHIAILLKHEECYDPITHKVICKHVLIRMPGFIQNIYRKVLNGLNDETGKRQLQRLLSIGAIRQNLN